jgi:5-enolpyruvylshikimate-3-phosphate synthase
MIYSLKAPKSIRASIQLPASKSISNRLLLLNKLSENPCLIENLSDSEDTKVMEKALSSYEKEINAGAAGTAMRFLTAYLATQGESRILTGTARSKYRPIGILVDALRSLGAEITYLEHENYPPLLIHGKKLLGGEIRIDSSVSSQYISALLLLAPTMEKGLRLHLQGEMISTPYIYMTISLMKAFAVEVNCQGNTLSVPSGVYKPTPFSVESDWTAASYWYEMLALGEGEVILKGLKQKSLQGDAKLADYFEPLGVETVYLPEGIKIKKEKTVLYPEKIEIDLKDQPDLAQTLVVSCCMLDIPFRLTGIQSLRIKETDRLAALKQEMNRLGYLLCLSSDAIVWEGGRTGAEENPIIRTYDDHRMAMSFAPISMKKEIIRIDQPDVVSKSYPAFWNELETAGFIINKE